MASPCLDCLSYVIVRSINKRNILQGRAIHKSCDNFKSQLASPPLWDTISPRWTFSHFTGELDLWPSSVLSSPPVFTTGPCVPHLRPLFLVRFSLTESSFWGFSLSLSCSFSSPICSSGSESHRKPSQPSSGFSYWALGSRLMHI